jgi:hypothetical protein
VLRSLQKSVLNSIFGCYSKPGGHMVKQIVAIGSFLLGGAGIGLVAHLQTDPMAFTSQPPPVQHESTRLQAEVATTVQEGPAQTTDEAITEFALDTLRASRATAPAVAERELAPCSAWYEVGAATIQEGGAIGSHAVRQLCRGSR